ncbi:hypothetical protein ES707_01313 [subsurface metagenome]
MKDYHGTYPDPLPQKPIEPKGEKPPVLSDEEITIKVWEMAQSSRDLNYDGYRDNLVRQSTLQWARDEIKALIQQAKEEVARGILEEVEELGKHRRRTSKHVVNYITINHKNWDTLKSKYPKG